MTIAEIEELERLEAQATEKPWKANGRYLGTPEYMALIGEFRDQNGNWTNEPIPVGNAALVAALRNSAPEIIALAKWAIRAKPFVRDALCLYEKGDHNKSLAAGLLADFPGGANE